MLFFIDIILNVFGIIGCFGGLFIGESFVLVGGDFEFLYVEGEGEVVILFFFVLRGFV